MRAARLLGAAVAVLVGLCGAGQAYDELGGVIESDLSITSGGGGATDYAVFGRGSDNGLWWRAKVGENWTDWDRIGDPEIMKYAPACATMDRRIHCAFVGMDNSVYLVYQPMTDAVKWDGPFDIGGKSKFSPTVKVSYESSDTPVFEVYVRGLDGQLFLNSATQGGWSGWSPLGQIGGTPVCTGSTRDSTDPFDDEVYVRGLDGQLFLNSATQGGWSGWSPLGQIGGTPVCAGSTRDSTDPFDDEVLCAWRDGDDRLFASVMANQPYTWLDTQGMSTGKPTITRQQGKWPYRMLVRGLDGILWYNNYRLGWQGWRSSGTQTNGSLACIEEAGDTICASRTAAKAVEVIVYSNSNFAQ